MLRYTKHFCKKFCVKDEMPNFHLNDAVKPETGVINDPLGHTHSLASSEYCFPLKFVFYCEK